jgi:DNA-binding MarR family transcriptional regulator
VWDSAREVAWETGMMAKTHTEDPARRAQILTNLDWQSRRIPVFYGLLNRGIAARLGINTTDLEILGILAITGPVSLTYLAEVTGLASGTVTLAADRLELAGFVRRAADPHDRRKVKLEPVAARMREAGAFYDPLEQASQKMLTVYSEPELELVANFLGAFNETLRVFAAQVNDTDTLREKDAPRD